MDEGETWLQKEKNQLTFKKKFRHLFPIKRQNSHLAFSPVGQHLEHKITLGLEDHWRLIYTEVHSEQMAFSRSPSLSNNLKVLNNDLIFTVCALQCNYSTSSVCSSSTYNALYNAGPAILQLCSRTEQIRTSGAWRSPSTPLHCCPIGLK